jgi:bifunctional UDP-N-acetylglucosamine pyrophosphorylase/glucosamine-1-phosphate N-acetyltransferase
MVKEGLGKRNQIIVVGIKACEVAEALGKRKNTLFVYQREQKGTGHAGRVALKALEERKFSGNIYVFPGDMGLITPEAIRKFKKTFENSDYDMIVLTGIYTGDPSQNYYGRIIRVPGNEEQVIEIKEYKDILSLKKNYEVDFRGKKYRFSKKELLGIKEFNAGVYAFRGGKLQKYIKKITLDNVQGEMYLTELVSIFNKNSLSVGALITKDSNVILAFNNRTVLKRMDELARDRVYDKLKDIITIKDREDFFIFDEVAERILELDKEGKPLDITIGKGAHIGRGVVLNGGVTIKKNAYLEGNVHLGENVTVWEGVHLSTYPNQVLKIGKGSEILQGDIVKGNLEIGENTRIESSVNMTGSDEYPTRIGNNVLIKGTSYVFGSIIEDDLWIEHSVLKKKYVERVLKKDGTVQPVRYVLPLPEGIDSLRDIP